MNSILKNTYNTRYISTNKFKSLLIRSDKIDSCSKSEVEYLASIGIKYVIDLRDLNNKNTNPFLEENGIVLLNTPMSIRKDKAAFYELYPNGDCFDYYVFLLTRYSKIKDLFLKIISTDGGILINCSAGRDRTGIVSFLIELIIGLNREEIAEDMAVSDINLHNKTAVEKMTLASYLNHDEAKTRGLHLYDWFFEKYNSVEHYFNIVFGSDSEYPIIKKRIIELCR